LKVPWEKISEIASSLEELQLSQSLKYGIGFIYEGMLERDREAVEELYHAGAI
jgi:superfamily II RNA helicase